MGSGTARPSLHAGYIGVGDGERRAGERAKPNTKCECLSGHAESSALRYGTKGLFAARGLTVELHIAPSSHEQRAGLANGAHRIIHSGVDNGVAMADVAHVDVAVVIGGDNEFNGLVVQPDIDSVAHLRGRTVIADSPDTAYAFQLSEILKRNVLNSGDALLSCIGQIRRREGDIHRGCG